MIEKLLEHLPYDLLERVKFSHLLLGSAGVGVLLFSAYFFTLYQTTHEELVRLQKKRTQTAQKLENYKKLVAQKDIIAKNLARSAGTLEAMKQQLPREDEMPGLLKEVASFGGDRGAFEVTQFQLQEGGVEDFYKKIPVALQMRGSFWDTLDFMDKMQNRLQLVNFSDLQMTVENSPSGNSNAESSGQNRSGGNLRTHLVANTYAYIDGAENKAGQGSAKSAKKTK
ncbi:MAG: pilus assembly protein PilO [Nitrospinaceae bacterium]|nr:MAG: pilus assembly protein PilO [Nitrospinaceae bacterium]